jgi:hypothetical protein
MAEYTEKHSELLQAMNEFTPRIEKIKNDFIQKELFIAKGFTNHLINTLSTEVTFYKEKDPRDEILWEIHKFQKRTQYNDKSIGKQSLDTYLNFDYVVKDFKDLLQSKISQVYMYTCIYVCMCI